MDKLSQFVFVIGPTASGKSDLALNLAEELKWPIINCDSVQVYQKLDIGTAKPTREERKKTPHHLFDYVPPGTQLNAADYLRDVENLFQSEKIENGFFVGGSGFYVQALEKGLYPNAEVSEEIKNEISQWIEEKGFGALYLWIKEKDKEFADKISENDHYRIRRAVEVMRSQSLTMTELKADMAQGRYSILPKSHCLKVGIFFERDILRKRVVERTEKMLKMGFVEEVKSLVDRGYSHWPPMQSVGYKEVQAMLNGEMAKEDLQERIVTSTMQLIKKQMTWFKRDQEIIWFDHQRIEDAKSHIRQWISSNN